MKEIRDQRHDFIKEYYKMAVTDLDRHLKAGWQVIVVLAGGAAVLTAGHDQKIAVPIAVTIALISALWGALSVIDANLWSLRAIAFLANVESIYFNEEDRRYFNPYVGSHPRYEFMESLRYMFWLCVLFSLAVMANFIWEISSGDFSVQRILLVLKNMSLIKYLIWNLPLFVFVWGIQWIISSWLDSMCKYYNFCVQSPGPGLIASSKSARLINLDFLTGAERSVNNAVQQQVILHLELMIAKWKLINFLSCSSAFAMTVFISGFFYLNS